VILLSEEELAQAEIRLGGLDCADCTATIQKAVQAMPGVQAARADFGTARLRVRFDRGRVSLEDITLAVRDLGYEAEVARRPAEDAMPVAVRPWWRDRVVLTTALAGAILLAAWLVGTAAASPAAAVLSRLLYAASIVLSGYRVAWRGLKAMAARSFDVDFLVTIAAATAPLIGQWWEGAMVMFLFAAGNAMEEVTTERTRRSVESLMDLAPLTVTVRRDGKEVRIPAAEATVGDVVLVRPGERLALDGTVVEGRSEVNQAPITGESMPVEKSPGSPVYAGTLNGTGFLAVEVQKPPGDTVLARIVDMVSAAAESRASVERFVDRFAAVYTPLVIAMAAGVAVVLPAFFHWPLARAIYDALALLLIACPCALVISTPVSIVAGVGNAARRGVLVKGGAALERAGEIRAVAFDKTGTLTAARPAVTGVTPAEGRTPGEVLALAAAVEQQSEHLVARAVVEAARAAGVTIPAATAFQAYPGEGASTFVDGIRLFVGSERLFSRLTHADIRLWRAAMEMARAEGRTCVLVGDEQGIMGMVTLADTMRPEVHDAVSGLKRMGIRGIAMLTGDSTATATAVATAAGIDDVRADLLPEDKLHIVGRLQDEYGPLAMVGDGINDAPALAAATLGIAMGALASDTALQAADVAVLSADLRKVPFVLTLGRATRRTIRDNIGIALALKALALVLLALGHLTLWMAVLADTGASVLVILNAMRLGLYRPPAG